MRKKHEKLSIGTSTVLEAEVSPERGGLETFVAHSFISAQTNIPLRCVAVHGHNSFIPPPTLRRGCGLPARRLRVALRINEWLFVSSPKPLLSSSLPPPPLPSLLLLLLLLCQPTIAVSQIGRIPCDGRV